MPERLVYFMSAGILTHMVSLRGVDISALSHLIASDAVSDASCHCLNPLPPASVPPRVYIYSGSLTGLALHTAKGRNLPALQTFLS